MKPTTLNPSQAIADTGAMIRWFDKLRANLASEAADIGEQWQQLGRIGAQRDDHAATLLTRLRPFLRELSKFGAYCAEQIDAMEANPFGRDDDRETIAEGDARYYRQPGAVDR